MTISQKDKWIQIAYLDEQDHIRFTQDFQTIMGELGWEAKAFAGHLLGLWYDPFEHMLDYNTGDSKYTQDQPGSFDCNDLEQPQDVVEYWAEKWSKHTKHHKPSHEAETGIDMNIEW